MLGRALHLGTHAPAGGRSRTASSEARRWGASHGEEWRLLEVAPHYTAAHHILRFLLGGLPGAARWRGEEDRQQRSCGACGAPATWAWTTARGGVGGAAWCQACAGPWHGSQGWAALPPDLLPADLRESAARVAAGRPALPGSGGWQGSAYGTCPLCGAGEAGAEHLQTWCPAAALAWRRWAPDERTLEEAIVGAGPGRRLAVFVHQLAYLHSALLGRAALAAEAAAGRLLRACAMTSAAGLAADGGDEGGVEGGGDEDWAWEGGLDPTLRLAAWGQDGPLCACCGAGGGRAAALAASAQPAATMRGLHGGGAMARWPVATNGARAGDVLARLRAEASIAGWLLPGAGWWPRPRCVPAGQATAQ